MFLILDLLILTIISDCSASSKLSFSSTYETELLLGLEIQLAESLRALPVQNAEFLSLLDTIYPQSLLTDLKSVEPRAYASHPLNAVSSAKRTGWEIQWLKPWIPSSLSNITQRLPSLEDYQEACSSVGLLIEAYQLNLTELCRHGRVRGHDSLQPPDWSVLMNIGISTFNRGWFDIGITLMEHALEVFKGSSDEYFLYEKELKVSKDLHDKLLTQKGPIGRKYRTFKVPFDEDLRKQKRYQRILDSQETLWYRATLEEEQRVSKDYDSSFFHQQCRSPRTMPTGRCLLLHNEDPFHKLSPFKLELLSESPFLGIFKDFMDEAEMKHFVQVASGQLHRSRTGGLMDSVERRTGKEGSVRTSKQTWLQETTFNISHFLSKEEVDLLVKGEGRPPFPPNYLDHLVVLDTVAYKITQRIGRATRLNMADAWSSEPFQIANYGLGGQYDLHYDTHNFFAFPPTDKHSRVRFENLGDRLGTFMVYLEDVQRGGATVFPKLGLQAQPSKGDGVFWINLLRNGLPDERMQHGGCPVLIGSKWITNKWINSHTQMLIHPCPLRKESDQVIIPNLVHY